MILLIDPHEEVLLVVVKDSSGVGPVTCHSRGRQKWRHWFVEQEMVVDELFLFRVSHGGKRVIFAGEFGRKALQCVSHNSLHFAALSTGTHWWMGNSPDCATSSDAGRQDVFLVKLASFDFRRVQINRVRLRLWVVAIVSFLDHGIKKLLENLVRFFVTSN
uniref:Low-density lipoprotein receptor-related protein 2-like n=1 Tax=Phallusia mammillata TaxID=59560 RepID=A0A6F9DKE0_9ASCI|nr:low-density lipoprotein receptor-related protein 2-like [Phallusia mammillata]